MHSVATLSIQMVWSRDQGGHSARTWTAIRLPQLPPQPRDVSYQQRQRYKDDSGAASPYKVMHNAGPLFASDGSVKAGGAERHCARYQHLTGSQVPSGTVKRQSVALEPKGIVDARDR